MRSAVMGDEESLDMVDMVICDYSAGGNREPVACPAPRAYACSEETRAADKSAAGIKSTEIDDADSVDER